MFTLPMIVMVFTIITVKVPKKTYENYMGGTGMKQNTNSDDTTDMRQNTPVSGDVADVATLLERAYLFLEDGAWEKADEYCEKVLDRDPDNVQAYLGKLLSSLHCHTLEQLSKLDTSFEENEHYKKVLRFADPELGEKIRDCASSAQKNQILTAGIAAQEGDSIPRLEEAIKLFAQIPNWKDADDRAELCRKRMEVLRQKTEANEKRKKRNHKIWAITVAAVLLFALALVIALQTWLLPAYHYHRGEVLREAGEYNAAIVQFEKADNYSDAEEQILATYYANGIALREAENEIGAIQAFQKAGNYKDTRMILTDMINHTTMPVIAAGEDQTVGLKTDGTVVVTGSNSRGQCNVFDWKNIVAVVAGDYYTTGLKSDGTAVTTVNNSDEQYDVSDWKDIVAVSAGDGHTIGLKSDGTVVATGYQSVLDFDACNVSNWTNIVAVSAGTNHTVGLKSDGTVVATGFNIGGQCNVSGWTDIIAVAAGGGHTVGLKSDGTVVATEYKGYYDYGQCNVSNWTDIVAIAAGTNHTVGLKSDGTVVATGDNYNGRSNVFGWTDIVAIAAGDGYTVGLKSDGTVVATGDNGSGQCDVSDWTDIGPYTAQ